MRRQAQGCTCKGQQGLERSRVNPQDKDDADDEDDDDDDVAANQV